MVKKTLSRVKNFLLRKVKKNHAKKQLFLIYSMGKVGTTSVFSILRKQYPQIPAHQVHFLSDHWVKEKLPKLDPAFHGNIALAEQIYESIRSHPDHRIKVVTMVREPMAREISDIFENWKGLFKVNSIHDLTVADLHNYLNNHDHEYVLNWFDTEFKEYLGFDIYSAPFDKKKGYSIYKTQKADILCMQTGKMNECLLTAMKQFCGLNLHSETLSNTSENKDGKEMYKILNKEYKAPGEKIKFLYNSKYVRHFFSDQDIDSFTRRWTHDEMNLNDLSK